MTVTALERAPAHVVTRVATTERRTLALAVALGLVTVVVGFVWRSTLVTTDPWHYVRAAVEFPAPRSSWNVVGLTRWGMIVPLLPFAKTFGPAEITWLVLPLLSSGVLVASIALLTARFWGRAAATVAAVLFVLNPVVFANLSRGYPDLTATALVTAAAAAAFAARDAARAGARRLLVAALLLVGFLLGWSYEVRETALMGFPVVAAILLWRGGPSLRVAVPAVAAPVLGWLAAEVLLNKYAYDEGLLRVRALTGISLVDSPFPDDRWYLNHSRDWYVTILPRVMAAIPGGWWMLAAAALAVVGGLLFRRTVGVFAAWFALLVGFFVAVGGGLNPAAPSIRLDLGRYWLFFLAPMTIAAVGTCAELARRVAASKGGTGRRRIRAAVAAATVLVCAGPVAIGVRQVAVTPAYLPNNGNPLAALRTELARRDDAVETVWADVETRKLLATYQRSFFGAPMWSAQTRALTGQAEPRPGDWVVLFSTKDRTCGFCYRAVHHYLARHPVPRTWRLEWQTPRADVLLYHVQS